MGDNLTENDIKKIQEEIDYLNDISEVKRMTH